MTIKTACHGEVEILDAVWYSIRNYDSVYGKISPTMCIGIVRMMDCYGLEKQYIGLGLGLNETQDLRLVLDNGVPFYGEI